MLVRPDRVIRTDVPAGTRAEEPPGVAPSLRNVIDANGEGVIFGGEGRLASRSNSVRNNVIANSVERFNVESSWTRRVGDQNSVRGNCLWSPRTGYYGGSPPHSGVQRPRIGFTVSGSTVAAPEFLDRAGGTYASSPARSARSPGLDRRRSLAGRKVPGRALSGYESTESGSFSSMSLLDEVPISFAGSATWSACRT